MNEPTENERKKWANQILDAFKKAAADIGIDLQPGDIVVELREQDANLGEDVSDYLDKQLNVTKYDIGGMLTPTISVDRNKITEEDFEKIVKIAHEKYGVYIGRYTPVFGKLELKGIKKVEEGKRYGFLGTDLQKDAIWRQW